MGRHNFIVCRVVIKATINFALMNRDAAHPVRWCWGWFIKLIIEVENSEADPFCVY